MLRPVHPHHERSAGAGKTLQARARSSILPAMTHAECLEITKIYTVAGRLSPGRPMVQRLFWAPHHTISHAGQVDGGRWPHPGAISWDTATWWFWRTYQSLASPRWTS